MIKTYRLYIIGIKGQLTAVLHLLYDVKSIVDIRGNVSDIQSWRSETSAMNSQSILWESQTINKQEFHNGIREILEVG